MKWPLSVFLLLFQWHLVLSENGESEIATAAPIQTISDGECVTSLENLDAKSTSELLAALTDPCRYDKLELPSDKKVAVYLRVYIYFLQNQEAHDLQFQLHALVQMRYIDPRLKFSLLAPSHRAALVGTDVRDLIWVPHLFLANEKSSSVLGTHDKDTLTSIASDGTVIVSERIEASLHCWMELSKFPFDSQECHAVFESWMYNTSRMTLNWETKTPVAFDPGLRLTEYTLTSITISEDVVNANLDDLRHGAFVGNYSSVRFIAHIDRSIGHYLMDYYIPSVLLVCISWISFWLQADQTAPRVMLGTSTLLTFITLSTVEERSLPKVNYVKMSEVWFLACTVFFFGALVEFALVNVIWRKKRNYDLKELSSIEIFSSAIHHRESADFEEVERQLNMVDAKEQSELEDKKHSVQINVIKMTSHEISEYIDRKARIVFPISFLVFNIVYWIVAQLL